MKKMICMLLCMVMMLSAMALVVSATECTHPNLDKKCTEATICPDCNVQFGPYPHTFIPATCKDPQKCETCTGTWGEKLTTHSGLVAATCAVPEHCTVCGGSWGEVASTHSGLVAATCAVPEHCTVCGTSWGEVASTHSGVVAATCAVPEHCTVCGTSWGEVSSTHSGLVAATCTVPEHCTVCTKSWGTGTGIHIYGTNGLCTSCSAPASSVTVTLSAAKATYNGQVQKPTVTVTAGGTVLASSSYSVAYNSGFKAAGEHTLTVTFNGTPITKSFVIEKATLTVRPADFSISQNDGQPRAWLSFSGLAAGETATVSATPTFAFYTTSGDHTWLDDPVHFMGKYSIVWTNMGSCDVTVSGGNGNYNINKVQNGTLTVVPTKAPFAIAGVKLQANVDGYAVNLHAVSDKNLDKILSTPDKNGTIQLKFNPISWLNYIHTVRIPTDLFEEIAEAANDSKSKVKALEVTLSNGRSVKFDAEALDDLAEQAEGKFVSITLVKSTDVKTAVDVEPLAKAQKKGLGERPAYLFSIASGKEIIEEVKGDIEIQIPYKLRYKEKVDGLKVFLIDEEGKRTECDASYNEEDDKVVWESEGLTLYVIEYEAPKK